MSRSKEMDLTTGNPFWSLLKFAIPVILGNLFQLFYTLADSVIVGKTLGADSLAAVGSTSIIIYFVFCFINGFTGGFGICLGQRCGAKDEKGMRKSIAVSTLLSIAFTVVLTLVCCLLAHPKLHWTTRLRCRPFRSIFLQMRSICVISRLIYGEKSTETF